MQKERYIVFLGISIIYLGFERHWMWMHSGEELKDSFWGVNQPSNKTGNREDCGVLVVRNNIFMWEDMDCSDSLNLDNAVAPVCQHDKEILSTSVSPDITTTVLSDTSTESICPLGWTEFQGNCYSFFSYETSWINAEMYCREENSSLVSIHSQEENDFLLSLAGEVNFWIGGYWKGEDALFWTDFSENDFSDFYSSYYTGCLYQYRGNGWSGKNCHSNTFTSSFICKNIK